MRHSPMPRLILCLLVIFQIAGVHTVCAAPQNGAPLPLSSADREGLSAAHLERLHEMLATAIREGKHSGAISLIARNGKIADWWTFGYRDTATKLPMEKDTICRVFSMTKLVTTVAVLQLLEEARFKLNDPIDKYIPEFKGVKVFLGGTEDHPDLGDPSTQITIKQLLTHTAGLSYGFASTPVDKLYQRSKMMEATSLKNFIDRVSKLPLAGQPGEEWRYSVSIDVLGYLVEVVSGMPFDRYVEQRILMPLQMRDTHFFLPAEKQSRLATAYITVEGKLTPWTGVPAKLMFPSGGGGLLSTTGDFARFGQMLLNGGQLDGVRVLSRKSVELMMTNQLVGMGRANLPGNEAFGFGFGGSIRVDLAKGSRAGSVGEFGWDGAASTFFRIDPKERTIVMLYLQRIPPDFEIFERYLALFYGAIAD